MWQIAGKIMKPSSVVSLLWFIFWRKTCLIVSIKYQEACFLTHTDGPYFDVVAGHAWPRIPTDMLAVALLVVSLAGQVKDDDPDKKEYPGPPGW